MTLSTTADETMTLTLSNASNARITDGTATGTIENSDPLQQAWIARFGRTVASEVVNGITDRLATPERVAPTVRIAGDHASSASGSTWTENAASMTRPRSRQTLVEERTHDDRPGAAHAERIPAAGRERRPRRYGSWTAWGRFSSASFEGETDGVELSGDVTTGLLGADVGTDDWIASVALSAAKGDGPFALTGNKPSSRKSGTVDSALTSVHPYAQVQATDRLALWAIGGYGTGNMTIAQEGDSPMKTDIDMSMAAIGARGTVLDASAGDALDLAVRTDALWLRTTSDATWQMAEGRRHRHTAAAHRRCFARLRDGHERNPHPEHRGGRAARRRRRRSRAPGSSWRAGVSYQERRRQHRRKGPQRSSPTTMMPTRSGAQAQAIQH